MAQDVTFWLAPKIPHIPDPPGPPRTVHFTLTWGHRQVRQNSLLWLLFKISELRPQCCTGRKWPRYWDSATCTSSCSWGAPLEWSHWASVRALSLPSVVPPQPIFDRCNSRLNRCLPQENCSPFGYQTNCSYENWRLDMLWLELQVRPTTI